MKILRCIAISLTVFISLAACATSSATKQNPADEFTFKHRDFDLRYAWKTLQTDKGVSIDGLIKNVRYTNIDSIEVKVSLLDKSRKVLAEGVAFPVPQKIQLDDYRNFAVFLKDAKLSEADQIRFLVDYSASDGQNALSWTSTFTVKAATGAAIGVGPGTENEW